MDLNNMAQHCTGSPTGASGNLVIKQFAADGSIYRDYLCCNVANAAHLECPTANACAAGSPAPAPSCSFKSSYDMLNYCVNDAGSVHYLNQNLAQNLNTATPSTSTPNPVCSHSGNSQYGYSAFSGVRINPDRAAEHCSGSLGATDYALSASEKSTYCDCGTSPTCSAQTNCATSTSTCLASPNQAHKTCSAAANGYYVGGNGLVAQCATQTGCATHDASAACVGTNQQRCTAASAGYKVVSHLAQPDCDFATTGAKAVWRAKCCGMSNLATVNTGTVAGYPAVSKCGGAGGLQEKVDSAECGCTS